MSLIEIFSIIIIHFIADFIMQDEKWALSKSKSLKSLINHTFVYSTIFGIAMCFILPIDKPYIGIYLPSAFFLITFVVHTLTDFVTSKIVSKKFKDGHLGSSIPNLGAFTIIGLDQVLHYIQLFLTYYLLTK